MPHSVKNMLIKIQKQTKSTLVLSGMLKSLILTSDIWIMFRIITYTKARVDVLTDAVIVQSTSLRAVGCSSGIL